MSTAAAPTNSKVDPDPVTAQPAATSKKQTDYRRVRRTNFISSLDPGAKKAFAQEILDGMALTREICANRHGVQQPRGRNVIGDMPTTEEIQEEATRTGLSEDEVRRREQLARREAIVELQERLAGTGKKLSTLKKFWTPAKAALAGVSGAGAAAALAGWLLLPENETPEPVTPTENVTENVVETDKQTLEILNTSGLAAPHTPLGEKIQEAFNMNPTLREQLMRDVEATLLNQGKE